MLVPFDEIASDALSVACDREMMDPAVTLDDTRRKLHVFAHGENRAVDMRVRTSAQTAPMRDPTRRSRYIRRRP